MRSWVNAVLVALVTFVGFASAGWVHAYFKRRSSDDQLQEAVLRNSLARRDIEGDFFITLECQDAATALYDIDSNRWSVIDPDRLARTKEIFPESFITDNVDIMIGATGGGIAAGQATKLWKQFLLGGVLRRQVVGQFLGAVCGYTFGYWLGSEVSLDCDSDRLRNHLRTSEWKDLERARFRDVFRGELFAMSKEPHISRVYNFPRKDFEQTERRLRECQRNLTAPEGSRITRETQLFCERHQGLVRRLNELWHKTDAVDHDFTVEDFREAELLNTEIRMASLSGLLPNIRKVTIKRDSLLDGSGP